MALWLGPSLPPFCPAHQRWPVSLHAGFPKGDPGGHVWVMVWDEDLIGVDQMSLISSQVSVLIATKLPAFDGLLVNKRDTLGTLANLLLYVNDIHRQPGLLSQTWVWEAGHNHVCWATGRTPPSAAILPGPNVIIILTLLSKPHLVNLYQTKLLSHDLPSCKNSFSVEHFPTAFSCTIYR